MDRFACSVTHSHLTLHDPMDCSAPTSSVHGILEQEYWGELPFPTPIDRFRLIILLYMFVFFDFFSSFTETKLRNSNVKFSMYSTMIFNKYLFLLKYVWFIILVSDVKHSDSVFYNVICCYPLYTKSFVALTTILLICPFAYPLPLVFYICGSACVLHIHLFVLF